MIKLNKFYQQIENYVVLFICEVSPNRYLGIEFCNKHGKYVYTNADIWTDDRERERPAFIGSISYREVEVAKKITIQDMFEHFDPNVLRS